MSVTEKIQEVLDWHCAGGYGAGIIAQANTNYLVDNYDFIKVERVYRLGELTRFVAPVKDSRKFGQFLEELAGLADYPIIDDSYYFSLINELEAEDIENIIKDNELDELAFWQVWGEGDYSFSCEQDYVYADFDVDELVAKVRERAQTFDVHYNATKHHYPKACSWCADTSLPSSALA